MAQPNPVFLPAKKPALQVLEMKTVRLYHPWRRYIAKCLDHAITLLAACAIANLLPFSASPFGWLETPEPALIKEGFTLIMLLGLSIVYDTFFLALWGTTPGKKALGLIVRTQKDQKLSWHPSFLRACYSNTLILTSTLIPFTAIPLNLFQKNRLHQTGFTTWDEADRTMVYQTALPDCTH